MTQFVLTIIVTSSFLTSNKKISTSIYMAESNPQQDQKSIIVCLSESDVEIIQQQTCLDMKEIRRQSEKFANTTIKDLTILFGNNKNVQSTNEIKIANQLKVKCHEYNELQKKFDIISKENSTYKQQINEIKKVLSNII